MTDNNVRSATWVSTLDGDTFKCRVILSQKMFPQPQVLCNVRVRGWSAAELNEPDGLYMRQKFDALLLAAKTIDLEISGRSFERIVAAVYLDGQLFSGLLAQELRALRRAQGHG